MSLQYKAPAPPSNDKRWKIVNATMRRNGYAEHALIEALHSVQDAFGYLDETAMRFVAGGHRRDSRPCSRFSRRRGALQRGWRRRVTMGERRAGRQREG